MDVVNTLSLIAARSSNKVYEEDLCYKNVYQSTMSKCSAL